ncbi:hypothetical protein KIPB_016133, partial [Kipferlia bialata]
YVEDIVDIRVETVIVDFSGEFENFGDISIEVTSPQGTVAELLPARKLDDTSCIIELGEIRLYSVRQWYEQVAGTWEVKFVDNENGETQNKVTAVGLTLRGVAQPTRVLEPTFAQEVQEFTSFSLILQHECEVNPLQELDDDL